MFESSASNPPVPFHGAKRLAESVLDDTHSVHEWLKQHNPALVGVLNFTLLENRLNTRELLEQKWPVIVAFLALYNVLKSMHYLSAEHDDAEQLITWYGGHVLLGESPRPSDARIAHHCLVRLIQLAPRTNFFPQPRVEDPLGKSILYNNFTCGRALGRYLDNNAHQEPGLSTPTNIAKLQLVYDQLSAHDQRRPYFDLLGFRNSVLPVLRAAARLCQDNSRWVAPGFTVEQEELVHYAILFINLMYQAPDIGSGMVQQLAEAMDNHIEAHGRHQLNEAERLYRL